MSEYFPINEILLLIAFRIFLIATIPLVLILVFVVYSGQAASFFLNIKK